MSKFFRTLESSLATSDSAARKQWARQIVDDEMTLDSLIPLLHRGDQTSQRFMWLVGDVCELDPSLIEPCLPLLLSLHDQMPFPGMPRSLAKWLWLTEVPDSKEGLAVPLLLHWMEDLETSIGCKSYAAKALHELAKNGRVEKKRLKRILALQTKDANKAFAYRMSKILMHL